MESLTCGIIGFCLALLVVIVVLKVGAPYHGYHLVRVGSGEDMAVGAHWVQAGTYGHTPGTYPGGDLSGYAQTVPTPFTA